MLQELIAVRIRQELGSLQVPEPITEKIITTMKSMEWKQSSILADMQRVVVGMMEIVEAAGNLPGDQKKQIVLKVLQCIDPNMNMQDASAIIDLVAAASKGLVAINQGIQSIPCLKSCCPCF